jgi:sugar fermentation stimulation protein A
MKKHPKEARLFKIPGARSCQILERVNRFVVKIEAGGKIHKAHINNTGRLQEFLVSGRKGFCFRTPGTAKTSFRLFAVEEQGWGALFDTQIQMKAFETAFQKNLIPWLKHGVLLKRNARLGESLLDFLFECRGKPVYLEVKSAVLRDGKFAAYPDCPSLRGRRHVRDLTGWAQGGGAAFVLFMAALPRVEAFKPNRKADAELAGLLDRAEKSGVGIKAMGLYFRPDDRFLYLYDPELKVIIRG